MPSVEFEVTAVDMAPEKTRAERLKFKLEMALMMYSCGRDEVAAQLLTDTFDLIDSLIADGI